MGRITSAFRGQGLTARVLRSASWTVVGQGGGQVLRLASNLILTRLLFPEAFGLMALVGLVLIGVKLFSDIGISVSIVQNPRGDDADFLDTAWTLGVIRGFGLAAVVWLAAGPVAGFYGQPDLALYLPLAGLTLAIAGFEPTTIETAQRHLLVGRVTVLDMIGQVAGIVIMVVLALTLRSVMALVLGSVAQAAVRLALMWWFLPGHRNRFRWERTASAELIRFGKWVFLSTAFWFLSSQGDRAVLGKFLTLPALGIYNIGQTLATMPYQVATSLSQRLMIPVYRDKPAQESAQNRRRQRQLRLVLTGGTLGLILTLAYAGPWLIGVMYDDRYAMAGQIVTLLSCALVPVAIGMTYDQAALAAGDSRAFFVYTAARATAQTALMLVGVLYFGVIGAIAAIGVAAVLVYPLLIRIAIRRHVWDWRHDAGFGLAGSVLAAGAIWLHWDAVAALAQMSR
jgi:O-antigen/teichoic acid export membrane protein